MPDNASPSANAPAWATIAVSLVVLVLFGAMAALVLFLPIPPGSEAIMNTLLGTVSAMAMTVAAAAAHGRDTAVNEPTAA